MFVQSRLWKNSSWYRLQENSICHYQISETETKKLDMIPQWAQQTHIIPTWKTAEFELWVSAAGAKSVEYHVQKKHTNIAAMHILQRRQQQVQLKVKPLALAIWCVQW